MLLWVLTEEAVAPKWVFVRNKPLISKVVLVMLNSLNSLEFNDNKDCFPFLQTNAYAVTQAPGSKYRIYPPLHVLLSVPLPKNQKQNKPKKKNKKQKNKGI